MLLDLAIIILMCQPVLITYIICKTILKVKELKTENKEDVE